MKHYTSALAGECEKGRALAMQDVYDSLSDESKQYIDMLCKMIVTFVRLYSSKTGVTIPFSTEMAFQLIWEIELYKDDPRGLYRNQVLELYQKYLNN